MGLELAIGVGFFLASAILSYVLYKPKMKTAGVSASGLDDFSITRATEGSVIPVVFGRVKITGNILWYGNLTAIEQEAESGGKGGGGGSTTTGHTYYLDCWQSICLGPVRILKIYKDNKEWVSSELNYTWSGIMDDSEDGINSSIIANFGNDVNHFTLDLDFFAPMPKVAAVSMKQIYCKNGTTFPTFHFVVESAYPCPYSNPSNGMNPANAVWYVLTSAGELTSNLDSGSFSSAASYWYNKGYGINMVVGAQKTVREVIEQILAPLGATYFEAGGKHYLFPNDPYAAAAGSVVDDFVKFTISRKSWEDTVNDIKATYVDEAKDFTERTAVAQNIASQNLLMKKWSRTYDLTLFRDLATCQKRLSELIKTESYPYAEVEFTTSLKHGNYMEGSIVNLTYTPFGISNASFRIVKKTLSNIDSNEIVYNGVQVVETLFDDNWVNVGTGVSEWNRVVEAPVALQKTRIMEVPRTPFTDQPSLLILAAKESGYETSMSLYYTPDGNDYKKVKKMTGFAMYGVLTTSYPNTTYDLDDEVGFTFTPYKSSYEIDSLSRTNLFSTDRFLIINNEIMKFQTVTLNVDGTITVTGIIRGVYNTSKGTHGVGAAVWIVKDIDCFFIPNNGIIAGYYKIVHQNLVSTYPIASVAAINMGASVYGLKPMSISRVGAIRTGSAVNFVVGVHDTSPAGAGISASTSFYTGSDSDMVVEYKLSTDTVWTVLPVQTGTFSITNAASFTVNVRAKEFGQYTSQVNLTVGTVDGVYSI